MHNRNDAIGRSLEQHQLIQRNLPAGFHANQSQNCTRSIDDTARESFRLSSFSNFSRQLPINVCPVAARGFFYTGFQNTIECFSCNETTELSIMTDERWLRQIHKSNCSFANGNDPRNIPIQEHSPYENGNQSAPINENQCDFPTDLRNSPSLRTSENEGYLSLTNGSARIQEDYSPYFRETFSFQPSASSLRSNLAADNPVATSMSVQRNNTNNVISIQAGRPNVGNVTQIEVDQNFSTNFDDDIYTVIPRQEHRPQPQNTQLNLVSIFPCNHPINPFMRSVDARLQTFYEHIETWSNSSQLRAPIDDIVAAGLFCLGERDRTKCWYCNGGLQNWKRDDDPWEEHAKWFPMCEFVLQKKGPDYVHRIVARFPNLRRPQMLDQITESSQQNYSSVLPIPSNSRSSNGGRITSGLNSIYSNETEERGPVIVDPEAERREREREIEDALRSSGMVTQARIMGFKEGAITSALKRQFELHNENFTNMDDFIDAIFSVSNNSTNREDPTSASSIAQSNSLLQRNRTTSPSSLSAQSALQEINTLTESRSCRRCHNNPACIVFIPCGHMVCCQECQNDWECCPLCHSFIREKIRTFLS